MITAGINIACSYYDRRFAFPVQIMFLGKYPSTGSFPDLDCILDLPEEKDWFQQLLSGLLICTVLNTFATASVPALSKLYYLPLHGE